MTPAVGHPVQLTEQRRQRRAVRKAVILAAGRGRRMGQLTADRPKAALKVGGHALLDWQIAALRVAGAEEIAVVTGHGAQALAGRDVRYLHNPDWADGTQVASLFIADDWIGDEPAMISYGDILYHPSAPLALIERPGDVVVAYDADHRWLWRRRFGDWLADSESFRIGPGQILTKIGGKPRDIEAVEGQFMGLMLMTSGGRRALAHAFRQLTPAERRGADVTAMLAHLISQGVRIDTAVNLLPWMEIDSGRDLDIARAMAVPDGANDRPAELCFPDVARPAFAAPWNAKSPLRADARAAPASGRHDDYCASAVIAVQNWGRSGSTLVQSLLDGHPQVLSTPNFYSRAYYQAWAEQIGCRPDPAKIDAFLSFARQWWDPAQVDAAGGLHRLGPARREVAGVDRSDLERHLYAAFDEAAPITRRALFEAAHVAYARALGRDIAAADRIIVFPIHSRARGVACALLEDFPDARFLHTLREPTANVAAFVGHVTRNRLDHSDDALLSALSNLFARRSSGREQLTRFGDRPYLDYLGVTDQVRFLPLEVLHRSGAGAMTVVADWLGLGQAPSLTQSTFDAKTWWNRPESGAQSRLGTVPSAPAAQDILDSRDRQSITWLARRSRQLGQAYGANPADACPGLIRRLAAALRPWRYERHAAIPVLRALEALNGVRRRLPAARRGQLQAALRFERKRAALEAQAHGAVEARKRLPVDRHSETVWLQIVLGDDAPGWRLGLRLRAAADPARRSPDQVDVAPAAGSITVETLRDQAFWRIALTTGALFARARAFIRMRALLLELLVIRWRDEGSDAGGPAPNAIIDGRQPPALRPNQAP